MLITHRRLTRSIATTSVAAASLVSIAPLVSRLAQSGVVDYIFCRPHLLSRWRGSAIQLWTTYASRHSLSASKLDKASTQRINSVRLGRAIMSFNIWYQAKLNSAYLASVPLAVFFAGLVSYILYQLFLHPLRRIPGPFTARFTRFWELIAVSKGDWVKTHIDLHKKYGTHFQDFTTRESSITKHRPRRPYCP